MADSTDKKRSLVKIITDILVAAQLLQEARNKFVAEEEYANACEVTRKLIVMCSSRSEAKAYFESALSLLKIVDVKKW